MEEGGFNTKTVFDMDQTGLFWKKMPKRTFIAPKEKTFPGFGVSKDLLTVIVGGNNHF